MRVMLVPVRHTPNVGGIETLLHHTLPAMRELGHEFIVVTGIDGSDGESGVVDGIPVYRFPFLKVMQASRPELLLQIGRRIGEIEDEHGIELRHVHGLDFNLWFLARREQRRPLPLVMSVHGTLDAPRPYSRVTFEMLLRADVVTAVSDGVRASIEAAEPDLAGRVRVIYNGIATGGTPQPFVPDGPLFAAGRMDSQKGFHRAIEAVAQLRAHRPHMRLRIAGDGVDRAALEAYSRQLGVDGIVDFLGTMAPAEVAREMAGASVVLVPSIAVEGFSFVAVEAAQLGRPVVASRVGGLPETVLDEVTGLLVDPDDSAALARAVDRILDDHAMGRRFGAAAVQHAARFGIDACAKAYSDVYDELGRAWQAPAARRGAR